MYFLFLMVIIAFCGGFKRRGGDVYQQPYQSPSHLRLWQMPSGKAAKTKRIYLHRE
jgi:hypothetical protein